MLQVAGSPHDSPGAILCEQRACPILFLNDWHWFFLCLMECSALSQAFTARLLPALLCTTDDAGELVSRRDNEHRMQSLRLTSTIVTDPDLRLSSNRLTI